VTTQEALQEQVESTQADLAPLAATN